MPRATTFIEILNTLRCVVSASGWPGGTPSPFAMAAAGAEATKGECCSIWWVQQVNFVFVLLEKTDVSITYMMLSCLAL